jgi:hypothetical protein
MGCTASNIAVETEEQFSIPAVEILITNCTIY